MQTEVLSGNNKVTIHESQGSLLIVVEARDPRCVVLDIRPPNGTPKYTLWLDEVIKNITKVLECVKS